MKQICAIEKSDESHLKKNQKKVNTVGTKIENKVVKQKLKKHKLKMKNWKQS